MATPEQLLKCTGFLFGGMHLSALWLVRFNMAEVQAAVLSTYDMMQPCAA